MKIIKIKKTDSPRWNRKEYKFYVLLPDGKIESGWPSKEDAKETYDELKEMGIKAKLVALRTLQQMGIDPEDKTAWHAGDFNKFMRKGDWTPNRTVNIEWFQSQKDELERRWKNLRNLIKGLHALSPRLIDSTNDSQDKLTRKLGAFVDMAEPLFIGIKNAIEQLEPLRPKR